MPKISEFNEEQTLFFFNNCENLKKMSPIFKDINNSTLIDFETVSEFCKKNQILKFGELNYTCINVQIITEKIGIALEAIHGSLGYNELHMEKGNYVFAYVKTIYPHMQEKNDLIQVGDVIGIC